MTKLYVSSFFKWAAPAVFFGALAAPAALAQADIRSYGARCDGSDDSAAVQAALDAVGSGGTVTISCSAGIGSRGLVLAGKSNVTVTGNGGNSGFRALASTGLAAQGFDPVMFLVQNCSNCVVRDLVIDIQNVGEAAIGFDRCSNSTLQNVSVSNIGMPAQAGIVAVANNGNSYIGNTVRNSGKSSSDGVRGMWIGNGNTQTEYNATITNNTVSDTGATGIVGHVISSTIRNNMVTNAAGAGIKIVPTPGMGGQSTISGNTLNRNLFHGVQIENADSPVIVQGNSMDANVMTGVYVSGGHYTNGRITGNTMTNNREAAVYLYNFEGLSIDNNTFSGNGHGIIIESNSDTMHDLQITSNTMTGQSGNGVTVWGRGGVVQNVAITSNSISNNQTYGMYIEQLSGSLTGFSASSNCYANNAAGSIFDTRGMIAPVAQSGNCAPAGNSGTTADKTAPSVSIASPGNGATVSGTVTVTANATDNVGVASVQFMLNGAAFGSKLTSAPYSVQWDTRTAGNGSYQWTAVAQDAAGNSTTSAAVFANVSNADTTAPTVRIMTPAGSSTVSGTVSVTASASDNIGVAAVQYSLDGAPMGAEVTASPYTYSWNCNGLSTGAHTLTATARDAAGNRTSASITVNKAAAGDTTAPTVRITSPAAGQTVSNNVTLAASASDNVGVAGVQYLVDGAPFGGEVVSGTTVIWDSKTVANGAHAISAIARDAAGNRTTATAVSVNVSNAISSNTGGSNTTTTTTAFARINVCGGAYTDPSGNAWSADTGFNGGKCDNFSNKSVSGTNAASLYQTQRWNNSTLTYQFAAPAGNYTVNLKFAELYFTAAKQRVFNVAINGATVLSNFDIVAAAGGAGKAIDKSFNVTVTGTSLTITMNSTVDDPAINAIEILRTTTTTTTTPPPTNTTPPTTTTAVARVNVCGGNYTDPSGNVWSADSGFNGGYCDNFSTKSVSGTTTPALYQTQRWNNGILIYTLAVPNGTYNVNLKFAELYYNSPGQRVFNIAINGQTVASGFDIVAAAGGSGKAIDKSFPVTVTNGAIVINMVSTVDDPAINAIELVKSDTTSTTNPPPNTTPPTPTTTTVAVARINVCGGVYTDGSGSVWSADSGSNGGYCDNFSTKSVAGTTSQALYQTQRWNNSVLSYQIPVANGSYTLNLKFAELYFTSPGQRVFNISVNGQTVASGFDIVAAAGGSGKAIDKSFPVSVTSGVITITMTSTVDDPAINAIEVLKTTTN